MTAPPSTEVLWNAMRGAIPVDWRGDETVLDVGGGNETLLQGLLGRQTGLAGFEARCR